MRIAMVGLRVIGEGSGGIEKAVEEISIRLAARGHAVTVFCRRRYNSSGRRDFKGVRLRNLPAVYTKHLEAISHTLLAQLFLMRGYDVVHFHATGPSLLSFVPRLARTKTVVTVHGLDWRRAKWGRLATRVLKLGEYAAVAFPNKTIVVSRFLRRYYSEQYGRQVVYIPNGVELGRPRTMSRLQRFGLEPGQYILFLSRLVPEKACHTLIEAFRQVSTNVKLAVVGDAPHMQDYIAQLKELAEDDPRIVFTGALYGADKEEAFSNARFFVLPSEIEGLPIVLLEAMSYGKCALVSDIPENVEVVDPLSLGYPLQENLEGAATPPETEKDPGPFGVTFRCADAGDLAEKIRELLNDDELVQRIGDRARAFVRESYCWDHITSQTERVYRMP